MSAQVTVQLLVLGLWLLHSSMIEAKPNLLLLLTDDLGYGEVNHAPEWGFPLDALNPNGGEPIPRIHPKKIMHTPNLARFAQEGIRATMSYAPSSVCGPSRTSIFSEAQVGSLQVRTNYKIENVEVVGSNLAGDLKLQGGYKTGYFGKWGLGRLCGGPWKHGFDRYVGQLGHNEAHVYFPEFITVYDAKNHSVPQTMDDVNKLQVSISGNVGKSFTEKNCPLKPTSTCTNVNDIVADEALAFMGDKNNQPFFVVWSPTYPHSGVYSKPGRQLSPVKRITPGREGTLGKESKRGHASQIEMHFDWDVGRLLQLLDENPDLDRNLLVVITSDNGAQEDAFGYRTKFFESTGGLRGSKRNLYDGGLRVPTIVRFKGKFPEGVVSRVPHALYDLGPTFREAAGLPPKLIVGPNGEPSGTVSMYQTWMSGNETLVKRDWLYFEICPSAPYVDIECKLAIIDLRTWRDGPVYKVLAVNKRKTKHMYDLKADPKERKPIKNQNLLTEIFSQKKYIRFAMDWTGKTPKTG